MTFLLFGILSIDIGLLSEPVKIHFKVILIKTLSFGWRIQINYFQRFDGYAGTSKGTAYGRVSSRLECQVYIKIVFI